MKKSIIISINPAWVAKILNGEKTIEVRKTAPKCDLPIQVYIYCTKGDSLHRNKAGWWFVHDHPTTFITQDDLTTIREQKPFNGKVVAKFTLRKISEIVNEMRTDLDDNKYPSYFTAKMSEHELLENSFLTAWEINEYLKRGKGYAWHISDLQIFDELKEISEFKEDFQSLVYNRKPRPPFSWCYVEEKE